MADAKCNIIPESSSSLHDAILLRTNRGAVLVNQNLEIAGESNFQML